MKKYLYLILASVLLICLLPLTACKYIRSEKKPNIIFIMIDTLRADHMGIYGYERNTTPNIDAFAKENLLFKQAVSTAPWTPPAVASMLSGLYPYSHSFMPPNSREDSKKNTALLSPAILTLPEILQSQGYQTYAISPNPWITPEFGFDQGFDNFAVHLRAPAEFISRSGMVAMEKLIQKDPSKPFFMYLHFLDPHEPYNPPGHYAKKFAGPLKSREYSDEMLRKIGLYNGEIAYMDEWIGKLFDWLKEKKLYEDSIIVVIGDHGEQFMEHGNISHGNQLVNPEIYVPFIIKTGRNAQKRVVDFVVSTMDIFPTILDLIGLEPPKNYQSISLLKDENSSGRGGVLSEIIRKYQQRAFTSYDGKRLLIGSAVEAEPLPAEDPFSNVIGVFDSINDFWEKSKIEQANLLKNLQLEFQSEFNKATKLKVKAVAGKDISEETIKQLESLGYLK